MTHEGFRDSSPAADDAARARFELEGLFARDQPAVTVVVKKRRLTTTPGSATGAGPQAPDADASADRGDTHERGPRVHRLASAPASAPAHAAGGSPGAQTRETGTSSDAGLPPRARRGRSRQDPSRRPSPVHVVLQAPLKPAAPVDEPAWRRILCVPPEEVSYLQVLQSLRQVQMLMEQAQRASRLQLLPGAG